MIAWREHLAGAPGAPAVEMVITDRHDGVGAPPYDGFNLADHVGDDPRAVAENRRLLAHRVGLPDDRMRFMQQVHGAEVAVVEGACRDDPPQVDAMVTREPGLALAVLVADCTPILLADVDSGVIGVAHAGRAGLRAGVVTELLRAMRGLGATQIVGRVGPSICGRCYEVPMAMREDVSALAPEARSVTHRGTPSLDVAAGVMAQLAEHCRELVWLPGCSAERADLFSHRRDGVTGRYAALAWLVP